MGGGEKGYECLQDGKIVIRGLDYISISCSLSDLLDARRKSCIAGKLIYLQIAITIQLTSKKLVEVFR